MGLVKDLFGKEAEDVTLRDVHNLITIRREEDRFLEYKSPAIVSDPGQLSQWVSAFLNAEGGLIIIGLCEDNPRKKEYLQQKIYPRRLAFAPRGFITERVEQLIYNNIRSSSKPAINVYPVRSIKDVTKAIFLVEIPQGEEPPYQASDGKYYRRVNTTKYAMEHYEIADLFGKRRKPSLSLLPEFTEVRVEDSTYRFKLRLFVANNGRAIARYTQFTASFKNLEIESIDKGDVVRSDDVRGGVPSIQWDYVDRVLHPTGQKTLIADLKLRLKENEEPCTLDYTLVAEDMNLIRKKYTFGVALLEKAKGKIEKGRTAVLTHREAGDWEG